MAKIYKAINAVQAALAKVGVSKDQKNVQQGFKFRGIDDVMNSLSPLLAEHGICMLPRVLERTVTERASKSGGILFYVTLKVAYCLVCAEDNSYHKIIVYGESMDSGDKATNKALSAAYKYAALQAFCIPTEGEDPDSTTHEVVSKPEPKPIQKLEPKPKKPTLSANLLALRTAIKKYNISDAQVLEWKQEYNVASLADLSDKEALMILASIPAIDLTTGEVLQP